MTISSKYGLTGIALSWLFVFPVLFSYLFYNVALEIGVSIKKSIKKVSNALIGSILMVAVILILKTTIFNNTISFGTLIINIVTGIVVYLGYFCLFSRETFQDVQIIWKNLRN